MRSVWVTPKTAAAADPPLALRRWSSLDSAERERLLMRHAAAPFEAQLQQSVASIVEDVRAHGDEAVLRALRDWDGVHLEARHLRITQAEVTAARREVPRAVQEGLREAIANSRAFNAAVLDHAGDWSAELQPGLWVGERRTPIPSAGLFVPCGKGSYPSVLVQLGTPAVVAGVEKIIAVVPPLPGGDGRVDPAVLVAADELGIEAVFRVNGPAGIAALAFGTETIPQALKVLGPGSPPVAAAQIAVGRYGTVNYLLLGPTECLILADDSADPALLAADLLNEAEHGSDSVALLVTDSEHLTTAVQEETGRRLEDLPEPRRSYARASLGETGGALLVRDLEEAVEVANAFAVEHLQLVVRCPDEVLPLLRHAAEVLIGQSTPISVANYVLGVPAALPTGRYARLNSGVTVETFTKKTSIARLNDEALQRLAPAALALAEHEGFPAHAAAVRARTDSINDRQPL